MKVGLLADAHGNREAFDLAVAQLVDRGAQRLYFLGDAVGYLPGTSVIEGIAGLDIDCVMGNHEAMMLAGSPRPDRDEVYRLAETAAMLDANERSLIESWPHRLERDAPCGQLVMVHGSPDDPLYGYVYQDTELKPLGGGPAIVFAGATHRPFVRTAGATKFVNVGSCGLPRDRGDLGSSCLFEDETGDVTILRFDIAAATAAALERCGPVADEVMDVFRRRGEYYGELC